MCRPAEWFGESAQNDGKTGASWGCIEEERRSYLDIAVLGLSTMVLLKVSGLKIHEAAQTTGWSPRMLRYIEEAGLIEPARSTSGYRLYGPAELQRLRTLRELLRRFDVGLTEVGFAARLRRDDALRAAMTDWFDTEPRRPQGVPADDWLRWEQEKHEKLLMPSDRETA